ncbi:MAG: Mth938-like domain-containing protein [Petrotogales bacterium]
MKIEEYDFGFIRVNGKTYENDIVITPEGITEWWRKEGHMVYPEDIDNILDDKPDMVIFGTGKSGRMNVTGEVKKMLENKNILIKIANTDVAKDIYNKSNEKMRVYALLHLTC